MTINEVESLLNITRANVRYYEKEGLLSPKRGENRYRDYSEEDIAILKRIIIFRKIGLPIAQIKGILDNEIPLSDAVRDNIQNIESQIGELKGSLYLSKKIMQEEGGIENFDQDHYFDVLHAEEAQGSKFHDLLKDSLEFEKGLFSSMWKYVFFTNIDKYKKGRTSVQFLLIVVVICLIRGLSYKFLWHDTFLNGFLYPFELFAFVSVVALPWYWLSRKYEKAARMIARIVFVLACLVLLSVFGLLIYGLVLHFMK